jgi:hypothetical protein
MNETCGCCKGTERLTPVTRLNRPGLDALGYRVGTHASFLETMKARLSNLELPPELFEAGASPTLQQTRPLLSLTTRVSSDPTIAMLDAWAIVADVLTFYQERIANEGFLLTATERRSILELARLVGYRLRPGVAASVYFAYTLEKDSVVEIPAGARAQSVPGPGELPQSFETSDKLLARYEWNNLKPRLTRPQVITLTGDFGTDAGTRETLYFDGVSTKLAAGDALLISLGNTDSQKALRLIETVDPQPKDDRTEVRLIQFGETSGGLSVEERLNPYIADAANLFSGSSFAGQIAEVLQRYIDGTRSRRTDQEAAKLGNDTIARLEELHDFAQKRNFTRLEPWIAEVLKTVLDLPPLRGSAEGSTGGPQSFTAKNDIQLSGFGNLFGLLNPLSLAPSSQPASSLDLGRTSGRTFAAQSDMAPQLLATFNPDAAGMLYQAWANIQTPSSEVEVDAFRVKAGLFPGTYPGDATVHPVSFSSTPPADAGKTTFDPPSLANSWADLIGANADAPPTAVALDGVYDKILPGSWIAIDRPALADPNDKPRSFHRVLRVQTRTRSNKSSSYAARVTHLTLDPGWLSELDQTKLTGILPDPNVLYGTVVYAQAELLKLAEEPLDRDVSGETIELDGLYAGLNSGRWVIVSGERTDIANVRGVIASELVMLAGVTQGPPKDYCVPFKSTVVPFSTIFYVSDPNANGDRLVVAPMAQQTRDVLDQLPLPTAPNQQYCEPVELAPRLFVDAYVPTADERRGNFSAFNGLLIDPFDLSKTPFRNGVIPADRLDFRNSKQPVFAWRIKSNSESAHTTLQLANKLAYSYDPFAVTIYGNVVNATHGETKTEVLGSGDGSQELQQFDLRQSPLTYISAATPAGAESTLKVRVDDVLWHETDNLIGLRPKDRRYITGTDDKDQTTVEFGNGKYGARLPTGVENVKAVYRTGIGKPGNVKARQITSVVTKPLGVKEVINPFPATGGADREDRDQARRNIPIAVMALDRLVSVQDYEDFARTYAGIAKASSARLSDGSRELVHLTIAGSDDIPIAVTSDLFTNLNQALRQFGDPYQNIQVVVRRLKLLVISAKVRLLPDYLWDAVEPKIRAALIEKFSFARRDLGQDALFSEALSAMQAQTGVAYVDLDVFDAIDENVSPQVLANLGSTLGLQPRILVNKAKVARHATNPAQRILPAELAYLNPAVADTLILTELSG